MQEKTDQIHRFLFPKKDVRGYLIQLEQSYQLVMTQHQYDLPISRYLGELLVSSVLLAANIKFEGMLIVQLESNGPIEMLVAKCSDDLHLCGLAKWEDQSADVLDDDFSKGQLAITLRTHAQGTGYQSVVPLAGGGISNAVENYFLKSEQVASRLYLAVDEERAAGLLLQKLPSPHSTFDDDFVEINTFQPEELLHFEPERLLVRLYEKETDVRLLGSSPIFFGCNCSRERVGIAIRLLGRDAVEDELSKHHVVELTCEFCNRRYDFMRDQVEQLFVSH